MKTALNAAVWLKTWRKRKLESDKDLKNRRSRALKLTRLLKAWCTGEDNPRIEQILKILDL